MSAKEEWSRLKEALLTGVSYMIPFVVAGGILIAVGFGFGGIFVGDGEGFFTDVYEWGQAAMGLMTAALGGYIAYSMADKPGLAPGFVAGSIAAMQGSGFIGAIFGGIVAGYIVMALKRIRIPGQLRSLLPVLIIPVVSVFAVGLIMTYVLGGPVTWLNETLQSTLDGLSGGSLIVLGIIQGAMLASDMGGPINKAAYAFALAVAEAGNWAPMSANFIASMTPPLAIAFAILIAKKRFTEAERGSLGGLFVGGAGMITEFAIPFAAARPLRTIPALMIGSATGAALSYAFDLTMQAPHGGLFVILLSNKPIVFILILIVASLVSALMLILFRGPLQEEEAEAETTSALMED